MIFGTLRDHERLRRLALSTWKLRYGSSRRTEN